MEKPDKSRSVLVAEYQFLRKLKGVEGVIQVVDFVSQQHQGRPNFIVMQLKGESLSSYMHRAQKRIS